MKKKTEVRVKRTTFYAVHSNGVIAWLFSKKAGVKDRVPVVAIDRRDLADLEARLKAAEAECKRLEAQRDEWKRLAYRNEAIKIIGPRRPRK